MVEYLLSGNAGSQTLTQEVNQNSAAEVNQIVAAPEVWLAADVSHDQMPGMRVAHDGQLPADVTFICRIK